MKKEFCLNNGEAITIIWDKETAGHKVNALYCIYLGIKADIESHKINIKEAHQRLAPVFEKMNVKTKETPAWYEIPLHIDWSFTFCYGTSMSWDQLSDSLDRAFDYCCHMVSRNCSFEHLSLKMAKKLAFGEIMLDGEKVWLAPKLYALCIPNNHKRVLYRTGVTTAPLWSNLAIKF